MNVRFVPFLTLIVAVSVAASAVAQQRLRDQRDQFDRTDRFERADRDRTQVRRPVTPPRTPDRDQDQQLERVIVTGLILGSKEQIELSRYAKDRVESDEVENFAEKVIEEHEQLVSELGRVAPAAARDVRRTRDRDRDNDNDRQQQRFRDRDDREQARDRGRRLDRDVQQTGTFPRQDRDRARMTPGRDQTRELMTFQRRASQKRLELIRDELGELDGTDLDKAYVGQQLAANVNFLAAISAGKDTASSELREILEDAEDRIQDLHEEAKELRRDLEDN